MASFTWLLQAQFDGSTWTDLAGYLFDISVRRGRAGDLDYVEAGTVVAVLDNRDGRFTPENSQSPYASQVLPNVPVRAGVTVDGTDRVLFTGRAQRWEPRWGVGERSEVVLEAVDGFEQLANIGIKYPYWHDVRGESPAAYWQTTSEAQGLSQYDLNIQPTSRGTLTVASEALMDGAPGSLLMESASGLATGDGGAILIDPPSSWLGTTQTLTLSAAVRYEGGSDHFFMIAIAEQGQWSLSSGNSYGFWSFWVGDDRSILFDVVDGVAGSDDYTQTSPLTWTEGRTYHVAFVWNPTTGAVKIYRDGSLLKSDTLTDLPDGSGQNFFRLGRPSGGSSSWSLSDVALWTSDKSSAISTFADAVDGHVSDLPGERISRVLDWAGWDSSARDIDDGTTPLAAVESQSVLDACRDAAAADGGVFYMDTEGVATFQGRRERWEAPTVIDYTDTYDDIYGGADATFTDDGSGAGYRRSTWRFDTVRLSNRVVVDSNTQGTSDGVAEDVTSQGAYGLRTLTISTVSNNTADNAERAQWELSRRKDPHLQLRALDYQVGKDIQADSGAALDLQGLVRVVRTPSADEDTIDRVMRVASVEHRSRSARDWQVTVGLLEADTDQPGLYGTAVYGTDYYGY